MINEKQKYIYNTFLYTARNIKNKPVKHRQDFTKLDSTSEVILKKLDNFFTTNSSVNYNDFFAAPYHVYSKDEYFDLQFYITRRAIKCYTEFIKKKERDNPDDVEVIDSCKKCCVFIYNYCKENKLTLDQYKHYIVGSTPITLQHLKEHKINFYTLHALNVENSVLKFDSSIIGFMIDNFFNTYNATRAKFIRSIKLKPTIRKAFDIVNEKLLIFA
jgi:hypothetical protein